jgi:DNA-binding MurR/RpiR family transcriptional regulator
LPAAHHNVLNQLLRYTNENYKKDTNYEIALQLLVHFDQIPNMTISQAADTCFVSTSSISRFIRMFGYASFSEFKEACKDVSTTFKIDTDYSYEVRKATKEDLMPIYTRYTQNVIENIQSDFEHLDLEQLDRICQMMLESDEICLFGLEFSTLLGQHFQSRMAIMKKMVKIGLTLDSQKEIARNLKDNAVVFIASIEGGYFYRNSEVIDILREKDAHVITLTMHPDYKLMDLSDEILTCGSKNHNTEGRISLLYIIEILLMHYAISYYRQEA